MTSTTRLVLVLTSSIVAAAHTLASSRLQVPIVGDDTVASHLEAATGDGTVHVAGYTLSADFPTTERAFDQGYNGGTSEAFVSHIATAELDPAVIFADDFEDGKMARRRK